MATPMNDIERYVIFECLGLSVTDGRPSIAYRNHYIVYADTPACLFLVAMCNEGWLEEYRPADTQEGAFMPPARYFRATCRGALDAGVLDRIAPHIIKDMKA